MKDKEEMKNKEDLKNVVYNCVVLKDGEVCGFNFRKLDTGLDWYFNMIKEQSEPIQEQSIPLSEVFELVKHCQTYGWVWDEKNTRWEDFEGYIRTDGEMWYNYQLFKQKEK